MALKPIPDGAGSENIMLCGVCLAHVSEPHVSEPQIHVQERPHKALYFFQVTSDSEVSWNKNLYRHHLSLIFTVRRCALHGLCDRNSVRPSVRLSVRLSHSWTVSTWFDLRSCFLRRMVVPSF